MVGRTLSHYRIVERLGAGGMGEVYRAHDEKLDRDVALKVLPEGALADEAARGRFRKEAHALSRLSHPHIAHLLDFDSEDGVDFLVMELVAGPSLAEKLRGGPLPEKDVLRLGAQLALGLQAAHEQGVVHRDLKPSNLHLTPDGLLKILDFGLARLLRPRTHPAADTATETAAGLIVGSPPYMAPELLRGRPPDARTDLYASGAVLYEMATGQRPFRSRTGVNLTDAILHDLPPPPSSIVSSLSPGLEALILKALDRDPELRHQTARDLLVDVERQQARSGRSPDGRPAHGLDAAPPGGRNGERTRHPWRWPLGIVAVAAALVVGGIAAWLARPAAPPRITGVHALATLPRPDVGWRPTDYSSTESDRLYYVTAHNGRNVLHELPLDGGRAVEKELPFPGVVFVLSAVPGKSAVILAGSQDGLDPSWVDEGWPLWRVAIPAGAPQRLGSVRATSADVSPDGRSLALTRGQSLLIAPVDGSNPRERYRLAHPASGVRWSPDGRRLRYESQGPADDADTWIWEIPVDTGSPRPLWPGHGGDWTGDGRHYVFVGSPTEDLFTATDSWWVPWRPPPAAAVSSGPLGYSFLGSSSDGRQLIASFAPRSRSGRCTLMRYDPKRRLFEPALGGESAFYAEPSPDGEWLAWVRYPEGTLWRSRPDGSERRQLTSPPAVAHLPRWSPDGRRIVFASQPDPSLFGKEVRVVAADGSESELIARPSSERQAYWDPCWLPDGSIIFSRTSVQSPGIFRYDPHGRQLEPVPGAEAFMYPKCSPKGDVLAVAYGGAESRWMLRDRKTAAWRYLGSSAHVYPEWTHDGRSLCALSTVNRRVECMAIDDAEWTELADTSNLELARWMSVPWMGLDAEDRPLVPVTAEQTWTVYSLDWEAP